VTDAASGQTVTTDDVPWASARYSPSSMNNSSMATFIAMPFPKPIAPAE